MKAMLDHLDRLGEQIRQGVESALADRDEKQAPLPEGWTGLCRLMVVSPNRLEASGSRFLHLSGGPMENIFSDHPGAGLYLRNPRGQAFALVRLPGIGGG